MAAPDAALPPIATALVDWQRQHGRHGLPWHGSRDPYRVWLSEIMLQQTQVTTVLGYYDRFLQRFPSVAALAAAPLDDVLGLWAGLGYYSRARNLHACAQAVVARHGGRFPASAALLASLPGIGPSTAAAIAAFCFDERTSILDGNVQRVLGRVLAFDHDLAQTAPRRTLWALANQLVPQASADMPAYTQGLMDLGSTVCTPRDPSCLTCPLAPVCRARRAGTPLAYPVKTRKLKRGARASWCLWVAVGDALWLQQRPATGIWGGLWTWPMFDDAAALHAVSAELETVLAAAGVAPQATTLPSEVHVLTHLDWTLHPHRLLVSPAGARSARLSVRDGDGDAADVAPALLDHVDACLQARLGPGRWHRQIDLPTLGLPAPLRRWLLSR
ncbi:MAG: A/G-specific adenine glycosylase [Leptothrix sp. (in: b-proteobacteria)]